MTVSICAALACNSVAMVGIATLTMNASTPNMNCAATTVASTHQRRESTWAETIWAETIWCMGRRLVGNLLRRPLQVSVIAAITSGVSISVGFGPIAAWKKPSAPLSRTFGPPSMYDYDMLVIGSGPSGRRAAIQFAKLGKSVLVVEKGRRVGGVSVHTGTI